MTSRGDPCRFKRCWKTQDNATSVLASGSTWQLRSMSGASFMNHPHRGLKISGRVALLSHGEREHCMPVDLASDLPNEPGVYMFKTKQGRVLYVGKATRLNERIRSYFSSNPDRHMILNLLLEQTTSNASLPRPLKPHWSLSSN